MSKQKKLVIKVNYENSGKTSEEQFTPDIIEEWDLKKIAITLLLAVLIIIGFYYILFNKSPYITKELVSVDPNKFSQQEKIIEAEINQEINADFPVDTVIKKDITNIEVKNSSVKLSEKENNSVTKPVNLSGFVARSQLTYLVKNKEPQDQVALPVKIRDDRTVKIYYFTEIKNMTGNTVFHIWKNNGKQIFKKAIKVKGPRWRAATYKTIDSMSIGNWQVSLIDSKGNLLDELNFEVIH